MTGKSDRRITLTGCKQSEEQKLYLPVDLCDEFIINNSIYSFSKTHANQVPE